MPERRGRERIFEIDQVRRPKGHFLRRIIAKYVGWVQGFGYLFCAAVATGIVVCWIYTVDEVAREKEVGKSLIKPHEEVIAHDKDAVVTRLAAKEWQHVADWAPVVEVCDDPDWVRRCRIIQQLDTFEKQVRELEKEGPLPPQIAKQLSDAEKEVDAWNKGEGQQGPRILLPAPLEGEVTGTPDIVGKFFKAGDAICKVVNFTDLRLSVKLSGTNVERVRVGMPAKVSVVTDYGPGCPLLGDAKLGFFDSARMQFNYALDGKETKALLLDWWLKHSLVSQEDAKREVALTPTEIEEAEVTCALRTESLPAAQLAKVPEPSLLEVDRLGDQNPQKATVVEGKHTGSYKTNYLAPEMQAELARKITEALKGKVARIPDTDPAQAVRVEGVSSVHNFLKMKAAVADLTMEEAKKRFKRTLKTKPSGGESPAQISAAIADQRTAATTDWKFLRASMDERLAMAAESGLEAEKGDRFFEGVVRLPNPTPELGLKVKEAYQKSPATYLKAKVEVVVGECRLAMLLFRQ
jgi:hypothetical protein